VANRDPEALARAIISSLKDRENARQMAIEGKRLVEEKFGVERMVEGTIRVYEELLNGTDKQ